MTSVIGRFIKHTFLRFITSSSLHDVGAPPVLARVDTVASIAVHILIGSAASTARDIVQPNRVAATATHETERVAVIVSDALTAADSDVATSCSIAVGSGEGSEIAIGLTGKDVGRFTQIFYGSGDDIICVGKRGAGDYAGDKSH